MISSMNSSKIARSALAPVPRRIASSAIHSRASSSKTSFTSSSARSFSYWRRIAFSAPAEYGSSYPYPVPLTLPLWEDGPKLRNHAEGSQILVGYMAQNVRIMIKGILKHCSKAHGGLLRKTLLNDPLKVRERASADKQDVVCIYRCHGGHGIFSDWSLQVPPLCFLPKALKAPAEQIHRLHPWYWSASFWQSYQFINKIIPFWPAPHHCLQPPEAWIPHFDVIANISGLCQRGSVCDR